MDNFEKFYYEIKDLILKDFTNKLDHQYHYGCMYLSASLLGKSPMIWRERIIEQIDTAYELGTLDFIEESIVLSMQYSDKQDRELLQFIRDKRKNCKPREYHALDYEYLEKFNANKTQELLNAVKCCKESGLLYDTFDGVQGSKDLVYHCRNLEILIKSNLILDEKGLEIISKAVSLIMKLFEVGTTALFFGRSQNSSYGLGSLYFILKSVCFENKEHQDKLELYRKRLESKIQSSYIENCGFRMNFSSGRSGADSYMYRNVYSSFLLSRLLLSSKIKQNSITLTLRDVSFNKYFQVKKVLNLKFVINNNEGNFSPIFPNDIRYGSNALVSYLKNGFEYSPIPFFTFPYSPLDKLFTRKTRLIANSMIYRLLSMFYKLNVFSSVSLEDIREAKKVMVTDEGAYLVSYRRINLGIVPSNLLDVIKSEYLNIVGFKLPTSTGMEKFRVIIYW
ncbi:hypothetical protein AAFX60_000780 [Aliivibrio fischeri]